MIKENLRTGTAGSGVTHRPEIVRGGDADDAVIIKAGNPAPESSGLLILVIDGDKQFFGWQTIFPGDQVPGHFDGMVLEIVTEGEISQHLEKRVMPRRIADILQVIMLAASPNAFLRGNGPVVIACLKPGEQVLELHHAGIGEHQGRVILWDQRTRIDDLMLVLVKIVKKGRTDVVDAAHGPVSLRRHARPMSVHAAG